MTLFAPECPLSSVHKGSEKMTHLKENPVVSKHRPSGSGDEHIKTRRTRREKEESNLEGDMAIRALYV